MRLLKCVAPNDRMAHVLRTWKAKGYLITFNILIMSKLFTKLHCEWLESSVIEFAMRFGESRTFGRADKRSMRSIDQHRSIWREYLKILVNVPFFYSFRSFAIPCAALKKTMFLFSLLDGNGSMQDFLLASHTSFFGNICSGDASLFVPNCNCWNDEREK